MVVRRGELSGVLVAGTYRSTDLLLEAIIELYPDLLLGRRGVTMRNEEGRWRKGRQWLMQCSNQNLFFFLLTQLHFSLFNFSFTQFSFDGDSCYALLLVTFLCLLLLYSLYKLLYHFND